MKSERWLHPLSYVFLCVCYSSMAIVSSRLNNLNWIALMALLLDWREGYRALRHRANSLIKIAPLVMAVFVIQLLFRKGGDVNLDLGMIKIYDEGLYLAQLQSMRIIVIYLCALSLSKLDFTLYKVAFAKLHLPEEIAFMISYMVQLIPSLRKRFQSQSTELSLRGIKLRDCKFKTRLEVFRILALGALAEVLHDSTRQAISLELRGFRSKGPRTILHQRQFTYADGLALSGAVVFGLALISAFLP